MMGRHIDVVQNDGSARRRRMTMCGPRCLKERLGVGLNLLAQGGVGGGRLMKLLQVLLQFDV